MSGDMSALIDALRSQAESEDENAEGSRLLYEAADALGCAAIFFRGYEDFYRLRSLFLRVAERGGLYLSAQDQTDARQYAERDDQARSEW